MPPISISFSDHTEGGDNSFIQHRSTFMPSRNKKQPLILCEIITKFRILQAIEKTNLFHETTICMISIRRTD